MGMGLGAGEEIRYDVTLRGVMGKLLGSCGGKEELRRACPGDVPDWGCEGKLGYMSAIPKPLAV